MKRLLPDSASPDGSASPATKLALIGGARCSTVFADHSGGTPGNVGYEQVVARHRDGDGLVQPGNEVRIDRGARGCVVFAHTTFCLASRGRLLIDIKLRMAASRIGR